MAARQLAGRRPLYFNADVSILFIYFFCRLISGVSGPIITKLCHMFGSDCNFLNWVKNLGVPPPKNWGPKNIKISDFATWSRISPGGNKISSIGKRRWKLQSLPYVCTKFGELWSTNGENRALISTYSIDFFGRSYLSSHSVSDCRRHVTDDVTAQREIRSVQYGRDSDDKNGSVRPIWHIIVSIKS